MAWKEFFKKHAKFKTLCLTCLADKKKKEREMESGLAYGVEVSDSEDDEDKPDFGAVFLTAASKAILMKWQRKARDRCVYPPLPPPPVPSRMHTRCSI